MCKKLKVDRRWANRNCKTCVWLVEGRLCPFQSCPKVFGWSADRKATERILEARTMSKKKISMEHVYNPMLKKVAESDE